MLISFFLIGSFYSVFLPLVGNVYQFPVVLGFYEDFKPDLTLIYLESQVAGMFRILERYSRSLSQRFTAKGKGSEGYINL